MDKELVVDWTVRVCRSFGGCWDSVDGPDLVNEGYEVRVPPGVCYRFKLK